MRPATSRRRSSLRTRWTAALLVTGSVPLALFAYATVAIQRRGLEGAERQLEIAVIDHVATLVDTVLADASEATHRVGQVLTDARIGDPEARLELARETLARSGPLESVAIYGAQGALLDTIARASSPATAKAPPTVPPLPAGAPASGAWLAAEFEGSRAVLRWVEPVERDGVRRAWVVGTLAEGALSTELRELSRDRFEDRADGVLLVDDAARVVAGGSGSLSVGASLAGRDLFTRAELSPGALARPLAWATEFRADDGVAMVGAGRSLPAHGWAVAVRRERAVAYESLGAAQRALAGAAAAFAAGALLLGTWLASRTTRPIARLIDLARAYGRRELSRRSDVRTGDELEALGDTLGEMAAGIAAGEAEIERRASVEVNLSRYLPHEVARAIAAGEQSIALGGERREIAVLFADVAAFTPFAESAPPERVVALLNELFSVLAEIVFRHGGTVDKFIGDCVMALFGAPTASADAAAQALAAAEDMHRFVEASAPAWEEKYGLHVRLGIGVSAGMALVGNLGSERRMDYTAIGDVVNVAARLEYLARPGQTLTTGEVRALVGARVPLASLGAQQLRGRQRPVEVFEAT